MAYSADFFNRTVQLKNVEHFDPEMTLFCGQAFRWERVNGLYRGIAHGRVLELFMDGGEVRMAPVTAAEFNAVWKRYFDLDRDYGALKRDFEGDPVLVQGMEYAGGMRVLNQEPFETLVSFIISANNNVKRITGIIRKLSARFGERINHNGCEYFAFPKPAALANADAADLAACGAGYRAAYIKEAAAAVCGGFDLEGLKDMPYEEAKKSLMTIKGVGGKVADCILLYALGFEEAFPLDVWMKRVVYNLYGFCGKSEKDLRAFIREKFGPKAGLAQQYLFHYARMNRLGI